MKNSFEQQLINMGFDEKSLRLLLDAKTIKKLPIKLVTKQEIYKAMEGWFYNPVHYYANLLRPIKGEYGHDDKFRYVLKVTLEKGLTNS